MQRKYLTAGQSTWTFTNDGRGQVIVDLMALIESLAGDGQEALISEAKIVINCYANATLPNLKGASIQPVLVVSDSAIASADNNGNHDVDVLIHAMTGGDFEMKYLGPARLMTVKNITRETSVYGLISCVFNLDISKHVRKAAMRLVNAATIAGDSMEMGIALAAFGTNGEVVYYTYELEISYVTRVRTARML